MFKGVKQNILKKIIKSYKFKKLKIQYNTWCKKHKLKLQNISNVYIKTNPTSYEMVIYQEILNKISDQYNSNLKTLHLPKAVDIDFKKSLLTLPKYEGNDMKEWRSWSDDGGKNLDLQLSEFIPEIIQELSTIDIGFIINNNHFKSIPSLVFNHLDNIQDFKSKLSDMGRVFSDQESKLAISIISEHFTSKLILSNADFYPNNFIQLRNGKIVLIDWNTWQGAHIIDYPESIAAYCFVRMWDNEPWRKNYIKSLRQKPIIKMVNFQKSLLIRSLELSWSYKAGKRKKVSERSIMLFKKALNQKYIYDLWNN